MIFSHIHPAFSNAAQTENRRSEAENLVVANQVRADPNFKKGVISGIASAKQFMDEIVKNDDMHSQKSNALSRLFNGKEKSEQHAKKNEQEYRNLLQEAFDKEIFTPLSNIDDALPQIAMAAATVNEETGIQDAQKLGHFSAMQYCSRLLAQSDSARITGFHLFKNDTAQEDVGSGCRRAYRDLSNAAKKEAKSYMTELASTVSKNTPTKKTPPQR